MKNIDAKQALDILKNNFQAKDLDFHKEYMLLMFKKALKEKETEDFIYSFSESVLDYFYHFTESMINTDDEPLIMRLVSENILKNPHKIHRAIREDLKPAYKDVALTHDVVFFTRKQLCRAFFSGKNRPLQTTYADAWLKLSKKEQKRLIDWRGDNNLTYWSNLKYETINDMLRDWRENEHILEILS